MMRKLFDVLFWLAASLYFGGLLVLGAIAAPAIFQTTASAHIDLPGIAPSLDATSQAGGEIFGVILRRFWGIEIGALAAILIALAGWMIIARPVQKSTWFIGALWLIVAGLVTYDAAALTPRVWAVRTQVRATASAHVGAPPGTAWPERAEFDVLHKRSELLGHFKVYALLAMVAVAAWRGPVRSGRRRL